MDHPSIHPSTDSILEDFKPLAAQRRKPVVSILTLAPKAYSFPAPPSPAPLRRVFRESRLSLSQDLWVADDNWGPQRKRRKVKGLKHVLLQLKKKRTPTEPRSAATAVVSKRLAIYGGRSQSQTSTSCSLLGNQWSQSNVLSLLSLVSLCLCHVLICRVCRYIRFDFHATMQSLHSNISQIWIDKCSASLHRTW